MKLIVSKNVLHKAVKQALLFTSPKRYIPITERARIIVRGPELIIVTTDMTNIFSVSIGCQTLEDLPNSVVVDIKRLEKILKSLGEDMPLTISFNEVLMTIRHGYGYATMAVHNVEEWPEAWSTWIPDDAPMQPFPMDILTDKTHWENVVSRDELRPVMNNLLVIPDGKEVTVVGTNAHVLLAVKYPYYNTELKSFMISEGLVKKMRALKPESMEMVIGDGYVYYTWPGIEIKALTKDLIPGQYPKWRAVIPKGDFKFRVGVKVLHRALMIAQESANPYTYQLILQLKPSALWVTARDHDTGEKAEVIIDADIQGPHIWIGVTSRILMAALKNFMEEEIVDIYYTDERHALTIVGEKAGVERKLAIVMPYHITDDEGVPNMEVIILNYKNQYLENVGDVFESWREEL